MLSAASRTNGEPELMSAPLLTMAWELVPEKPKELTPADVTPAAAAVEETDEPRERPASMRARPPDGAASTPDLAAGPASKDADTYEFIERRWSTPAYVEARSDMLD